MTPPLDGKTGGKGAPKKSRSGRPSRDDRVEVSDASRKLKAGGTDDPKHSAATDADEALARTRATAKERIASGFYNRKEVASEIARRILDLLGFKQT